MTKKTAERISVSLPPEMKIVVEEIATTEGVTVSVVVRDLMEIGVRVRQVVTETGKPAYVSTEASSNGVPVALPKVRIGR